MMTPEQLILSIERYIHTIEEPLDENMGDPRWTKYLDDALDDIYRMIDEHYHEEPE